MMELTLHIQVSLKQPLWVNVHNIKIVTWRVAGLSLVTLHLLSGEVTLHSCQRKLILQHMQFCAKELGLLKDM